MDFFSSVDPDTIADVLTETVVPIAVEFVWAISPMIMLERLLGFLCDLLGLVDDVLDVVNGIGDFSGGVVDTLNPANWFDANSPDTLEDGDLFAPCDGDQLSICKDAVNIDCDDCLTNPEMTEDDCGVCRHCWKVSRTDRHIL